MPNIRLSRAIRFSTTTRGNGKVFTLISTGVDAARWTASSTTKDGRSVPAKVHTLPDGRHVLVVPAITANQSVVVTACDEKGTVVAQAKHRVDARIAKLRSQANTALHNPKIDAIRNCDGGLVPTQLSVSPMRLIPNLPECDLLHLNVFFATYDPKQGPLPIDLQLLGEDGQSLALGDFTQLGDVIEQYPRYPGVYYRVASFSVSMPMGTEWFCLGASCSASDKTANFVCVQPHEREWLFTNWQRRLFGFEGYDPNYEVWFKDQRITKRELAIQARTQELFAQRPTFSFVVPLYHTPLDFFAQMSSSVLEQSYPKLELVLVNSTPEDAELSQTVDALARQDERVRVVTLERNLGITENTNAGLEAATGDFVCFFDHDDIIEPDLLYWYVKAINDEPKTDILYCNEDKLIDGHYVDPFYKPGWSLFFLESNNYICHLLCVRKSIVDQLPRLSAQDDGAQDHSMVLAASELARRVHHVPKVLYHWRAHSGSTAADSSAKPESLAAGRRAVERHFERLSIDAKVADLPGGPHRFVPTYTPRSRPSVTAVIAPGATASEVERTVASLKGLAWPNLEIIDCGTSATASDTSARMAEAAAHAKGDYLLLVNAGTYFEDASSFEQMLYAAMRPDVALVAAKVLLPDGSIYSNGMAIYDINTHIIQRFHHRNAVTDYYTTLLPHEVSITTSECMVMSTSDYEELGGLLPDAPPRLWGTCLCLAACEAGKRVVQYSPSCVTRLLDERDLTLDIERIALEDATDRAYLLAHYPQGLRLFDPLYKPQF